MLVLPLDTFEPDVLLAVLEDIVTRDGTDYGDNELSVEEKVGQLLVALKAKQAFLSFDNISESCVVITADEMYAAGVDSHA